MVTAEYSTDLFEAETIRSLLNAGEILLEGIAAAPEQRLSEFPLIERIRALQFEVDSNRTAKVFPSKCVV